MNELPKVGDIIVRMQKQTLWIVTRIDAPIGAHSPTFFIERTDGNDRMKLSGWTLASSFWEPLQKPETLITTDTDTQENNQ